MPPYLLPEAMLLDDGIKIHLAAYKAIPKPSVFTSISAVKSAAAEHLAGSCCEAHQQKWRVHSWNARVVCLKGGGSHP